MDDQSVIFWMVALSAVLLVGIGKGGFGGGGAALATPLMAQVMPVADAAALLLPLLLVMDSFNVFHYRDKLNRPNLILLLPSAVVGIFFGSLFFNAFAQEEQILKLGLGLIALLFVGYQTVRTLLRGELVATQPPAWAGRLLGVVAGFTSTLAHVGGPPYDMYVLPQKLDRSIYVGTTSMFFFLVNILKLIPYGLLGLLKIGNLNTTLLLIPIGLVGIRCGQWLNVHFSERLFLPVVYALLFLTGLQLVLGRSLVSLLAF